MSAPVLENRRPSMGRLVGFVLLLAGVSLGLCVFSAFQIGRASCRERV